MATLKHVSLKRQSVTVADCLTGSVKLDKLDCHHVIIAVIIITVLGSAVSDADYVDKKLLLASNSVPTCAKVVQPENANVASSQANSYQQKRFCHTGALATKAKLYL